MLQARKEKKLKPYKKRKYTENQVQNGYILDRRDYDTGGIEEGTGASA